MLLLFLVVFTAVLLVTRAFRHGASELLPGVNVAVGMLAGAALAAPRILPGLPVARASARNAVQGYPVLPVKTAVNFVFSSFYGLPLPGSEWFGPQNYYEITVYVGVIALVLAGVALIRRWKNPEVLALAVVGVVVVAVVYFAPLRSLLDAFPNGAAISWNHSLILTTLPIALLAGLGMDMLVVGFWRRRTVALVFAGFGIAAVVLIVLAGIVLESQIKGFDRTIRENSFLWPVGTTAVGLLVLMFLWERLSSAPRGERRHVLGRGWIAGMVLLLTETAFLVSAGAPLWSASSTMFPTSAAVAALQRAVGSSTVGFAKCHAIDGYASDLGILPDANVGYSVSEFAVYDSALPAAYYRSWTAATGQQVPAQASSIFCPSLTTATLARLYGVAFVLQTSGGPPVTGATFDRRIDGEDLYRVPGAAQASLIPVATQGNDVVGTPVAVTHPDPTTWRMGTSAESASELRLRLTDSPGWQATIDGRPLALNQWAGVMLETRVPPGHHLIVLQYEPDRFTQGLVIAGGTIVVMIAALTVPVLRRRSRRSSTTQLHHGRRHADRAG